MCFKRIAILLAVSASVGCGVKVSEKPPEPNAIGVDGNRYSCVGQIAVKVNEYVEDKLSEDEINEYVTCLQNAFLSFGRLTHGSSAGTYKPEELRKFIQDNFLRNKTISDQLMQEFMVIKQAFVGGKMDEVSRNDLSSAISILEDIRVEAIRMKPHIKVLNLSLLRTQSPQGLGEKLREAQAALDSSIGKFSARLTQNQKIYRFANLAKFMTSFREFIDWETQFPNSKSVDDWIDFYRAFKEISVAKGDDGIAPSDWTPLLSSFSCWYMVALQYQVGVKDQTVFQGAGFENVKFLADETFHILEDAVRRQPGGLITFDQMDRLFAVVKRLGWLPEDLRVESLQKISRVFLNKIFGSSAVAPKDRVEGGLSEFNLAQIEAEFYRWARIQTNLIAKFNEDPRESTGPSLRLAPPLVPPIQISRQDSTAKLEETSDWTDFNRINDLVPLYRDHSPLVYLDYPTLSGHSFYDLSVSHLVRSLMNLLFKGYSDDGGSPNWDSTITEDQMQDFFEDVKEFGSDLKFIDIRNKNTGRRSFLEGNLFTYIADGVKMDSQGRPSMTMWEGYELLAFLYSGGQIARGLNDSLSHICTTGENDQFGHPKIERECVRKALSEALVSYMPNAPGLVEYIRGLSQSEREDYAGILLDTAYSPVNSNSQWVEYGELSTIAVIAQYSEAVLTRYDLNHDGALDEIEVDGAFKTFESLVEKIAQARGMCNLSEWKKLAGFKYIVSFKAIPDSFFSQVGLTVRDWLFIGFGIHEDRMKLADVFRAIIKKLAEANNSPKSAACPQNKLPTTSYLMMAPF